MSMTAHVVAVSTVTAEALVRDHVAKFLARGAARLEDDIVQHVPHDTGILQSSITVQLNDRDKVPHALVYSRAVRSKGGESAPTYGAKLDEETGYHYRSNRESANKGDETKGWFSDGPTRAEADVARELEAVGKAMLDTWRKG